MIIYPNHFANDHCFLWPYFFLVIKWDLQPGAKTLMRQRLWKEDMMPNIVLSVLEINMKTYNGECFVCL